MNMLKWVCENEYFDTDTLNTKRRCPLNTNPHNWCALPLRPGRLTAAQTEITLGLPEGSCPILIKARLLKPLGNPPQNAPKYFGRNYVDALAADDKWLSKASDALVRHWRYRNSKKNNQ